ncbi:GH36-type glycosyl hydrolase domain-containing protein [Cellulomonas bogoriensis]|uniref:N,N'-diacetylchitobiose phosphorylase n=1 Tax=Cellulomonas bogoriensis 69B4 = DSM 16987 TaxID=1386082 RepID=A0A0A0BYS7_9CELL|nr:glycosyl hydrolase family 65 protein [Cellulomonas bogoriensis]KGM13558.1 N,N'-diacetylchitobiose phosphorylase [Cellulomonas bogoriensis 69B4 = DSM 16987]
MRYGYFDDAAREYVITRPDTPRSWINYLGSRLYGGITTQNSGGYSFFRSGGTGRVLRMRFNGVPVDEPGRFVYLRDDDGAGPLPEGDFWSASWQPVGKPLDGEGAYTAKVRHGLGYSVFEADYGDVHSEMTTFIPRGQAFEYWALTVTNTGQVPRRLSVFSYAELANEWNYRQDLENLQYSQYVVQATYADGMIHRRNSTRDAFSELWFALAGAPVASFDTDRDAFLGPYRTPSAPWAVERGECSGSETVGDNSCASLHARLELAPGESRQVVFCLGVGSPDEPWTDSRASAGAPVTLPAGREVVAEYATPERVQAELDAIRQEWADHVAPLQVRTPDPELDSMVNVWHAYQTHMTFNWSRGVSLVEAGDRDGLGYRDTVQDMLAVIHAIPEAVRERLDLILTGQTAEGGGMPLVKPLEHVPGRMPTPSLEQYRSDDALWLPITVAAFVRETGDLGYLDQVLPYADHGEADVFGHLVQALQFSLDHLGDNGLVQGLAADWNDCLQFGTTGESMFSTFLLANGLRVVRELALESGRADAASWAAERLEALAPAIDKAWDGQWFIRGISATGAALGSHLADEGQIYLEPNVWAVISGAVEPERATAAMDSVHTRLASEHGVALCDPPHTKPMEGVGLSLLVFPVGHKENGGIFCHANSWTIVAEAMLGRGDRAYEYYRSYLPARYNDSAEVHQAEPYVYAQFTHGPTSPRFGQARNPWLTGTASWTYVGVTQHILGIRPALDGLEVDPCLPTTWDGFEARRRFRGAWVTVKVENPDHVSTGVVHLDVDGTRVEGTVAPGHLLREGAVVTVRLGASQA